ncbi:MAG: hypothetical protein JNK05_08285 [Myxococcales bacterium]|nr:hypothetical protein [Myxococcales bacterium]
MNPTGPSITARVRITTVAALTIGAFVALYHASRIAVRDGRIPYELEVSNPLEAWLLLALPSTNRAQITPPPTTIALLSSALVAAGVALALTASRRASPRYALAYAVCAGLCLVVFLAAFAAL